MVNFLIFTPDFHIIALVLVGPELVAHWLHPVQNECPCSASWFGRCLFTLAGSAAVVVRVRIIPCCTLCWQRRCLQCLQPWECRLVSWHAAAYLASPSLSPSFEMKEEAVPWAIFTDAVSLQNRTHIFFLCFLVGAGAAVDLQDDGDNDDDILAYCLGLFQELLLINSLI